jgi:two-component system phosphate regulon response regulator PhoB
MSSPVILLVEDESEVRDALLRDLEPFESHFRIEATEDTEEAREIVNECAKRGDVLALALCDHILPGQNGIEFLIELKTSDRFPGLRKVLVTGQAGLEDTIEAVNRAGLDYYITKPWGKEKLQDVVRHELTEFVLQRGEDLMQFVDTLEGARILEAISHGTANE